MHVGKYNTITLSDDKQYVVISKINYENNSYLYLVDIHDHSNVKFCIEKKQNELTKLIEVEDPFLLQKLIGLFANDVKDLLEEIKNNH